jgi:broad specificity phosphatase PhoE
MHPRIILIRHGECHGNRDLEQFAAVPYYTIELTERGVEQAREAGLRLKEVVEDETLYFYVSPFWRTRSTFEQIAKAFPRSQFVYSEEPRLREQEWGYLRSQEELHALLKERREYGSFYYRFPGGEAASDVYDRINDFLGSLHRDMSHPDFPQNCVLVTHSLAIRLFIMRWFHLTVEEFESMKPPHNAELIVMEYNPSTSLYELKTPLETDPEAVIRSRPIRL